MAVLNLFILLPSAFTQCPTFFKYHKIPKCNDNYYKNIFVCLVDKRTFCVFMKTECCKPARQITRGLPVYSQCFICRNKNKRWTWIICRYDARDISSPCYYFCFLLFSYFKLVPPSCYTRKYRGKTEQNISSKQGTVMKHVFLEKCSIAKNCTQIRDK